MQDSQLPSLIEANVAAFLVEMGAAGGGDERFDEEVRWTVGGSPIGYHNAVVRCDVPTVERARELVDVFMSDLQSRQLPGSWHLTPSMRPDGLEAVLLDAGFQDGGDEPAMAAELPVEVEVMAHDLAISHVVDADDMGDYREVLAAGFGEGPKEAGWVATVFSKIGYHGAWTHLLGRARDRPVACASLLMTPPVGGIYFVCTIPEARRRGYGAAITHRAMSHSAAAGASHAVLGSSPMGQRIYGALGFRTIFRYRLMEWEP